MKEVNIDGGQLNPAIITGIRFWVLLDNGHASSTPGKRSPMFEDGKQFREYEFSRDIVKRITKLLDKERISYKIIVPEVDYDVPLTERARRTNEWVQKLGKDNCLFVSIHANAAGNGTQWMSARGWSIYTTKGKTKSDEYATIFWKEASKLLPKYKMTLRSQMTDGDPDYEENFTVIYKANCSAVLTENLFMDNKEDCKFLLSEEGRDVIAQIHVNAIKRIINERLKTNL